MNTAEKLESKMNKRFDKIERMMRPNPERDIWTQADIAAHIQVSEATVRRLLKNHPKAPAPLAASTDENGQALSPRYAKARVLEWVDYMDRLGQSSRSAKASASAR